MAKTFSFEEALTPVAQEPATPKTFSFEDAIAKPQAAVAAAPKTFSFEEAQPTTAKAPTPKTNIFGESYVEGVMDIPPAAPVSKFAGVTPSQQGFAPPNLQEIGVETDPKARLLNALVGPTATANPKVINALYAQAEKSFDYASAEAQKAFRSGATDEQAREIFESNLQPPSSVKASNLPVDWKDIAWNSAVRSIKGGVASYKQMGALGASIVGADETAENLLKSAQQTQAEAQQYPASIGRVSDVRNPKEALTRLLEGSGENAVFIIESAMGAKAAKILVEQGAKKFAERLSEEAAKNLLEKAPKYGAAVGAFGTSSALESGEILGNIYDETGKVKPSTALLFGIPAGALDAIVPFKLVNANAKQMMAEELGKTVLQRYGKDALINGGTEKITEAVQTMIEQGALTFEDGRPLWTKDNLLNALDAAYIGFGSGVATQVAGQALSDTQLKLAGISREDYKSFVEAENKADAARKSALDKWKTQGLTPSARAQAPAAVTPEAVATPAAAAQPAAEPIVPPVVSDPEAEKAALVQKFIDSGHTKDNARLLAEQQITEAENARRIDSGAAGDSAQISGKPGTELTAEGTQQLVGPAMDGVGVAARPVEEGTPEQPAALETPTSPLVELMRASGANFKTPAAVKTFLNKVAPEEVAPLVAANPKVFRTILDEWKATQAAPVEQATPPVSETATIEAPIETPTPEAVQAEEVVTEQPVVEAIEQDETLPHVVEAKQIAAKLRRLDPYNDYIDTLNDPGVTLADVAQGRNILAEYRPAATAPQPIAPSEETASINEINSVAGQLLSPQQLRDNPPTVVNDYADLPVSDDIKRQAEEGGVKAFVDPSTNKSYLIASQIPKNEVKGTILHEHGGHIGLMRMIGIPRLGKLAGQVATWAEGGTALENTIAKEAVAMAKVSGEKLGSIAYEQEVVAYFTEIAVNRYGIDPLKAQPKAKQKVAAWLKELWQSVISALQKLNVDPSTLTAEDIVKLVHGAARVGTAEVSKAESKVVFTPEMVDSLLTAMANSPAATKEMAESKVEEPKIKASAKDLSIKLGFTTPGIDKTFIEMFYDRIKQTEDYKTNDAKTAVDLFVGEAIDKPEAPVAAEVSVRRILSQLPEETFQNALDADSGVIEAWEDPEAAAKAASSRLSKSRTANVDDAIRGVRNELGSYGNTFIDLATTANIETLKKARVLLNTAIAKYSMAGNKIIAMTKDNEATPVRRTAVATPEFIKYFIYKLENGTSLKQAFSDTYNIITLGPRSEIITSQLGPEQTGWIQFSGDKDADALQLVTSDTGDTDGNWCVGRDAEVYGKSELSKGDLWVYLKNGQSRIAAHVKPNGDGTPFRWYGLGTSQRVLADDEKYKSSLPTLPIKQETTVVADDQSETYNKVADILNQVSKGDEQAIERVLSLSVFGRSAEKDGAVEKLLKKIKNYKHKYNNVAAKFTGLSVSNFRKLAEAGDNVYAVNETITPAALFPELAPFADEYGVISFPQDVVQISLNQIPDYLLAPIDVLTARYNLNLIPARKLAAVGREKVFLDGSNQFRSGLIQSLEDAVWTAQDMDGRSVFYQTGDVSSAFEGLKEWYDTLPRMSAEGYFDINAPIDSGKVITYVHNPEGLSGSYGEFVSIAVKAALSHNKADISAVDLINIDYWDARDKYMETIPAQFAADLASEIRAENPPAESPRILASKKVILPKVKDALLRIKRSNSATEMGNAVGDLITANNFEDVKEQLGDLVDYLDSKRIAGMLPNLTTYQITSSLGKSIPHLAEVTAAVQHMDVMRNKMLANVANKSDRWTEFNHKFPKYGMLLNDVMHFARLQRIDFSAYTSLNSALAKDPILAAAKKNRDKATKAQARASYQGQINDRIASLTQGFKLWNELGSVDNGEGHNIFSLIKNHYQEMFNLQRAILDERVANSKVPGDINDASTPKGRLMAAIRKTYETVEEEGGVYFPYMRYGNYWLRVGKGEGKEFYMFESEYQRNRMLRKRVKELQAAGDTRNKDDLLEAGDLAIGNRIDDSRDDAAASDELLKGVFKAIDTQKAVDKDALKDAVYQLYLMTMPEQAFRKKYIHAKGTTGFNPDALRNFVRASYTSANQLSKLKYGPEIRNSIEAARASLAGNPKEYKLDMVVSEVEKRVELEFSPPDEDSTLVKAVNGFNQFVFLWRLTSPRAALVNLTALPNFGLPTLISEFGEKEATVGMAKFAKVWEHTAVITPDGKFTPISVGFSNHVQESPVLKQAFEEAVDREITEVTRTHDLLALARTPSAQYRSKVSRGYAFGIKAAGYLFHHTERLNREIMFMTSFELAYNKNLRDMGLEKFIGSQVIVEEAYDKAIEKAIELTNRSMFNYTRFNRPRYMRHTILKPAVQFRLYAQQVTENLITSFLRMLPLVKGNTAKRAAMKQFVGTLLMVGLEAGITGMPFAIYALLIHTIHAIFAKHREEDDPPPMEEIDLDLWFRNEWMPQVFGEFAKPILKGPISYYSNVDIGSSTSLANIWFRDSRSDPSTAATIKNIAFDLGFGAGGGILTDFGTGYDDIRKGFFNEGINKFLPAPVKGPHMAWYWGNEGVITKTQMAPFYRKDQVTPGMLISKSLGFNPTELTIMQEFNYPMKKIEQDLKQQRAEILDRMNIGLAHKQPEVFQQAILDAVKFSKAYPELGFDDSDKIVDSLTKRAEIRAMADHGLVIDPRLMPRVYKFAHASRPPRSKEEEAAMIDQMIEFQNKVEEERARMAYDADNPDGEE